MKILQQPILHLIYHSTTRKSLYTLYHFQQIMSYRIIIKIHLIIKISIYKKRNPFLSYITPYNHYITRRLLYSDHPSI